MFIKSALLFTFAFVAIVPRAFADPLGTIPTVEDRNLRFIFDFRSDLWSSPYSYKASPIRVIEGEFRLPLYRSEEWKVSFDLYDESLNLGRAEFSFGKESVFLGNALHNQSMGLGAKKDFESGASLSLFASYATASDHPYGSPRNSWIEGGFIYKSPQTENRSWIFAVNQSNNRGIENGKPFPYFGVMYEPDPEFTALYGFPFLRLRWGIPDALKTTWNLTPFGTRLDLEKNLRDHFVLNVFMEASVRSYLLDQRLDENDRIYYHEVTLEASLKKNVTKTTGVVFGVGYSFERRLYESEVLYAPNAEMSRFENDFYGRLGMEFRL